VNNVTIITGEEDFLKHKAALEEARSSLCEKIEWCRSLEDYVTKSNGSFSHASTVWVCLDFLEVPNHPENDDVLIVVLDSKYKGPVKGSKHLNFPKLKTYDDNNEVVSWIIKEGNERNIDLTVFAGALFVSCGYCLSKLESEIEKISDLYKMGVSDRKDIISVLVRSNPITPKEIVNAVSRGSTKSAIGFYDTLQDAKDETGWIIAYLHRFVVNLRQIESGKEKGLNNREIAESIGLPPFILEKELLPKTKLWSKHSLRQSAKHLADMDVSHKSGKSVQYQLESEIIRLSEEANHVINRRS
jgi:DNA polymerase III delta subunit